MNDVDKDALDLVWRQTMLEKEQDLATARAAFNEAVAKAERRFAANLSERVIALITPAL